MSHWLRHSPREDIEKNLSRFFGLDHDSKKNLDSSKPNKKYPISGKTALVLLELLPHVADEKLRSQVSAAVAEYEGGNLSLLQTITDLARANHYSLHLARIEYLKKELKALAERGGAGVEEAVYVSLDTVLQHHAEAEMKPLLEQAVQAGAKELKPYLAIYEADWKKRPALLDRLKRQRPTSRNRFIKVSTPQTFDPGGSKRLSLVARNTPSWFFWQRGDGSLFVQKQADASASNSHEDLAKELRRAHRVREAGIPTPAVFWHPDGKSLLREYLPGKSLAQMANDPGFWVADSIAAEHLGVFLGKLAGSGLQVSDVTPDHLIYSNGQWYLISPGSTAPAASDGENLSYHVERLARRTHRGLDPANAEAMVRFFKNIDCEAAVAAVSDR